MPAPRLPAAPPAPDPRSAPLGTRCRRGTPRRRDPRRRAGTPSGNRSRAGWATRNVSPGSDRGIALEAGGHRADRDREPSSSGRPRRACGRRRPHTCPRSGRRRDRGGGRRRPGLRQLLAREAGAHRRERGARPHRACRPPPFWSITQASPSSGSVIRSAVYPTMPPECPNQVVRRRPRSTARSRTGRARRHRRPRPSGASKPSSDRIRPAASVGTIAARQQEPRVRAHVHHGRDDRAVGGVRHDPRRRHERMAELRRPVGAASARSPSRGRSRSRR